jgi:phosphotransferase system, enzyme I, PtsP
MKKDNIDLICSVAELSSLFEHTSNLEGFLQDLVEMVADHMIADACSILLLEEDELVLRATKGLSRDAVGEFRMRIGEGITGLALKELRPIREGRVTDSPSYKRVEGLNEEQYNSFLAVPIVKGPGRIGVIVLHHRKYDYFTDRDAKALRAIASQLATVLENAELLMKLHTRRITRHETGGYSIDGTGTMDGYVIGTASRMYRSSVYGNDDEDDEPNAGESVGMVARTAVARDPGRKPESDCSRSSGIGESLALFDEAFEKTQNQLTGLQRHLEDDFVDVAGLIFTAHLLMLRDENFSGKMRELVEGGACPERAIRSVADEYVSLFSRAGDSRLREKAQDVRDLEHRLLANVYGNSQLQSDYSGQIIIARDLFPSEVVKAWIQNAAGLVLSGGGISDHISILSRSLGLPVLISRDRRVTAIEDGVTLILDTAHNRLIVRPSQEVLAEYEQEERVAAEDEGLSPPEICYTADDVRVRVFSNVNLINDAKEAARNRAEGIGLYRSEFPFIVRNDFPSEEEQYRIYRKVVALAGKHPLTFRTLDIGGDKMPSYLPDIIEANPFLGLRGIRFSLANIPVFHDQIRAMLRAGAEGAGEIRIMFPMISSMDEFLRAKESVEICLSDLEREGLETDHPPQIGAMIEVPAAVSISRELARSADFLCVGTNDLIMYTLAVDRTNQHVSELFKAYHPAVLRSLSAVSAAGREAGVDVTVCGNAASDPGILQFLIGVGVRTVSIEPRALVKIKNLLHELSISHAEEFARQLLSLDIVADIEAYLLEEGMQGG